MEKEKVVEILNDWNFWRKDLDAGILRETYLNRLLEFIKSEKIISIVGVRRSGKSTLIRQMAKELIDKGAPRSDTLIINFEEPQFEGVNLNFLIKAYQSYLEIIKPQGKPFLFLDEIQNVKNWERFVRGINEKKEAYLVVSGSSSKLLSKELASILTGRQLYFEVMPLSFKEFLNFKDIEVKNRRDMVLSALEIKRAFREYLQFGGFPEVTLSKNEEFKKRVLLSYYQDIMNRDLVQRFKVRKIDQLRTLLQFYLTNISSPISFNSISRFIKLPVETIRRFSSYIEISNLIFFVKRFSFSVKEQENSARKVYSIDPGLHNAIGLKFSGDIGKLAENTVALKLRELQRGSPLNEFFYWKNHHGDKEVNFVVKEGQEVKTLIQVCWDISDEKTRKRETSGLLKAMEEFDLKEGLVLTEDYEGEEKIKDRKIFLTSLWKWLCK